MAVEQAAEPQRRIGPGIFAGMKLRVLRNGFRGKTVRIVMFVLSIFLGVWFGGFGCLAMVSSMTPKYPELTDLIPALGGALLTIGWLLGPLVWFGVDETLDPARFALLPLPRRTLIGGLFAAALIGVPAAATLLATSGLAIGAGIWYGIGPALAALAGVLLGVFVCVALSRSMTSAFANLLRSRRVRDLAAVGLALIAALVGPLQIFGVAAVQKADFGQLRHFAAVVGWTPLGAPWTVGVEASRGHWVAAAAKLLIAAATVVLLLRWWSHTIETAMVGATSNGTSRRVVDGVAPVARLYGRLRWLPANATGAMVVREARYWWRDARRRANLITFSVIGVFLPVVLNFAGSSGSFSTGTGFSTFTAAGPGMRGIAMISVGVIAAVGLANQFGYDGTAYALHLTAGVPGRLEMRTRVAGYSLYMVPLMLLISVAVSFITGDLGDLGLRLGTLLGAFGVGAAVNLTLSVYGAYSLPETSNPFAVKTGGGFAKSLLGIGALIASLGLAAPLFLGALVLGEIWRWIALPVGLAYGLGAVLLGIQIAGDAADRRGPELLAAVTPRD
nr:ABC transporter permease [Hamadaea tsunoensis]